MQGDCVPVCITSCSSGLTVTCRCIDRLILAKIPILAIGILDNADKITQGKCGDLHPLLRLHTIELQEEIRGYILGTGCLINGIGGGQRPGVLGKRVSLKLGGGCHGDGVDDSLGEAHTRHIFRISNQDFHDATHIGSAIPGKSGKGLNTRHIFESFMVYEKGMGESPTHPLVSVSVFGRLDGHPISLARESHLDTGVPQGFDIEYFLDVIVLDLDILLVILHVATIAEVVRI